ncbi:MAG: MerR family transcriptional regulator [Actinomycetota bacterium]
MTDLAAPAAGRTHTIAEASAATGVTIDTLRYYERAGVLPDIGRTGSGQRAYSDADLDWVVFVRRLRSTGMSMRHIARYTAMVRDGDGTVGQRRRLLEEHRATVAGAIEELTAALDVLDRKIAHYEAAEQGSLLDCDLPRLRHVQDLG